MISSSSSVNSSSSLLFLNTETKKVKLDQVESKSTSSNKPASDLNLTLSMADSFGKLLNYYSNLANYANQVKMFNSIDYYANLFKLNNNFNSNTTFLNNLNLINLINKNFKNNQAEIQHQNVILDYSTKNNKINQQSNGGGGGNNKKLTNFSVDALLSSNKN